MRDVTYYASGALYDAVRAWRDGGDVAPSRFNEAAAYTANLLPWPVSYTQNGMRVVGANDVIQTRTFGRNAWGVHWNGADAAAVGQFPQYFRQVGDAASASCAAASADTSTTLDGRTCVSAVYEFSRVSPPSLVM